MKVQPFAYQTSHLVWKSLTGNLTSRSLEQRLFVEKASLTADRGRCLLWGNEAEVVSTTTRRPPHHVAVSRVLGEGLALGRAACGVVSTTATSTRLLPLLDAKTAGGFIIDHTPGALCPPCCPPGSAVVLEMNEEPAALLSELRRERRRRVGVYGKVLRSS